MTSDEPATVVFAGYGATGKTTFLAALWHSVLDEDASGTLKLEKIFEGDRDYINRRQEEWLKYNEVRRTRVDHDQPIQLSLRDRQSGRLFQLGIPDLSGETFRVQFEERRASSVLIDALTHAAGIALFVNPKKVEDPTCIRDAWDAIDDSSDDVEVAAETSGAGPASAEDSIDRASHEEQTTPMDIAGSSSGSGELLADSTQDSAGTPDVLPGDTAATGAGEFNPALCCTQVKYVDLLQQLSQHIHNAPVRCAVIVSAMDALDGTEFQDKPELFVRRRMSMLDQFLLARRDLFESRIYGVSAQGGDYSPSSIEALAQLGSERIRICIAGSRSTDITRPVRWLAFGDE